MNTKPMAVLFDLDGTLIDTAPDLINVIQNLQRRNSIDPTSFEELRSAASKGAVGLIGKAFQTAPLNPEFQSLKKDFLIEYKKNIYDKSNLYPGVRNLITQLEINKIKWGIVTNKSEDLTFFLIEKIQSSGCCYFQPKCVICGDTVLYPKPSPLPIFEALKRLEIEHTKSTNVWYVGDDPRDGIAAQAAQVKFFPVDYGYESIPLSIYDDTKRLNHPTELLAYL